MNSFFISKLNEFLALTQNKLQPLGEQSFIIKNINFILNVFAIAILSFSLFASSNTLGLLVLGGFAFLILKYIAKKGSQIKIDTFDLFAMLYVGIFFLATAFSSWFAFSIHGLLKILIYFFSYLLLKEVIRDHPKSKILLISFLAILTSIETFFATLQQVFGVDMLATWQDMKGINAEQVMNRVYGTLKPYNPNLLGGYLVATMPSLIGCSFYNWQNKRFNILSFIALLATLLAIIFTGCRGAYISVFAQGILFIAISGHIIWHDFPDKKWLKKAWLGIIIAGILGAVALIFSSPALQHRITSIFAARADSSNSFRINVYYSSFKMFLDNWLTGIGVGNWTFREVYGCYMTTGYDALGAYSVPLEIAVETGVFGLLNFISMIVFSLYKGAKNILNNITYNDKIITLVCFLSIAGMMTHGIVDTVWFRPQIQFIFWLMYAIISSTGKAPGELK